MSSSDGSCSTSRLLSNTTPTSAAVVAASDTPYTVWVISHSDCPRCTVHGVTAGAGATVGAGAVGATRSGRRRRHRGWRGWLIDVARHLGSGASGPQATVAVDHPPARAGERDHRNGPEGQRDERGVCWTPWRPAAAGLPLLRRDEAAVRVRCAVGLADLEVEVGDRRSALPLSPM